MSFSQEYIGAIVLLLGALLKAFGLEIENPILEAIIGGGIALWIAVRRFKKGDISLGGVRLG